MISGKTKEDLIKEIAKFGNVYLSCLKIGINASTYYRWKEKDKLFKEEAEEAERDGRKNICHVAEHALLKNVTNGQQRAIEYALNHNSEVYRKKETSNVVIVHKKELLKANPAGDFDLPKEFACLSDDDVLDWLNGVVTALNEGKASKEYNAADVAAIEPKSGIIPFIPKEEDKE